MKICGLQKTTLLDYPGHVAATIFTGGCNLRCPFCHNSDLLGNDSEETFSREEVLSFLQKRRSILEGVCITGGEPTLQPDLSEFIQDVRKMGYLVKLDTNGFRPDVLKKLAADNLLDYVAMDIKSSREHYAIATGNPDLQISQIEESVEFLMDGTIPYEFRTTAVKGLHSKDDFIKIGQWIRGCSRYFIQNYTDSDQVLRREFESFSADELREFQTLLTPYISQTELRGV